MKTNIILSVFFAAVVILPSLRAESPTERAFKQARAERDKAAAVLLEPVNRRYKEALDKLYRQAIEASDLDMAKQIQAELQAVGGSAAAANPGNPLIKPAPPPVNPGDRLTLKKLVENSQWKAFIIGPGGKKQSMGYFTFLKDGKFAPTKQWGGWEHCQRYEIEAPDVLKIFTPTPKKERKAPYRALRVDTQLKTAKADPKLGGEVGIDVLIEYDSPLDRKK